MEKINRFSMRLTGEALFVCAVSLTIGLVINHGLVVQGFTGGLTAQIKKTLQEEVSSKARTINTGQASPDIIIMDIDEAKALCDHGQALFVDARPPDLFARGHIHGALNITEQTLEEHLFELLERPGETKIVIYCTGPECPEAIELAELFVEQDIRPVFVYTGGWEQWVERGYPAAEGPNS